MFKVDFKDKQLYDYLSSYCLIMHIGINDYILDAIETQLNKDLSKIKRS